MEKIEQMWVEKYRPRKLDDIIGQKEIVSRLKVFVEKKSLPHLLFSGPPGVGKTCSALCLANEHFGESWRQNFLELNASDERGIGTIRTIVKNYSRIRPIGNAPYKIIYLDESDALTSDAQHALRRTMEKTQTCRFILACNYSSRIIEPIQSRCAVFRFKQLSEYEITEMLERIASAESLTLTSDAVKAIVYISEGDMRKAINTLQAGATLKKELTGDDIYKVGGIAYPKEIKEMLELALKGDFKQSRDKFHNLLLQQGLSGEDILGQVHRETLNLALPETLKVELIDRIAEFDFRLREGASEKIQLEAMLAQFVHIGKRNATV